MGTVLQDTYEITSLLGKGGMGSVFLAQHRRLPGRQVAVKVLQNSASLNPELYARFRREAEIASQLGHPNIVEVLDFDALPDGTPFLIMECLRGESLEQRLERGRLPLEQTLPIIRQIGSALQAAHRAGVVHRDLKPANVFLVPTDSGGVVGERVKLLDFGISKMLDSQTLQTQEAVLMGTPQYMAPEQALGKNREIDARTDLFALGCIVYEMLSGTPPFAGDGGSIVQVIFRIVHAQPEPLATLCPDVPERIIAAMERALSKDPGDRQPDVATFIEELTGSPLQSLPGVAVPSFSSSRVRSVPALAKEGGFAATHMPSSTARFPAPAAEADDVGFAATHVPSSTARFPAPVAASADDIGFAATLVPASTVMSQQSPVPASAAPVVPQVALARRRPSRGQMVGAGVLLLGCMVAGFWFIHRFAFERSVPTTAASAPATPAPTPAPVASPPGETPAATKAPTLPELPAPPAQAVAAATAPVVVLPPPRSVAPAKTERTTPSRQTARQGARETLPDAVKSDLDAAERALASGDFAEAIHLAQRSQKTQITQASFSLLARAYCRQGDLSNVRAQVRNLPPRETRKVRNYCSKHKSDF